MKPFPTLPMLLVLLLFPAASNRADPVKVYLCAGQSNMEGHGQVPDLNHIDPDLLVPRDDVWIVFAGKESGWLEPGYGYDEGQFGPELSFGHVMGDAAVQDVLIFKSCIGGTTLYNDWLPPSAAAAAGKKTGYLYETLVTRAWNLFDHFGEIFPGHGKDGFEIAGFIWFQGENDSIDLTYAKAYRENLVHLIHDLRHDLGAPDMPFIIGEINDSGCWTYDDIIRAAQVYADEHVPGTTLVETSDLDPGYHYDSESIVIIGERFAAAALESFEDGMEVLFSLDQDLVNAGVKGGAGVAVGDPQFVGPPQAKKGSGALALDGDDAVTLPGYPGVTGIKDRTCALWIRTTVPGSVLSWGGAGPGERWEIGVDGAGLPYLDVGQGGAAGSVNLLDGAWHHVAVVSRTREVLEGGKLVRKQLTDDVEMFVDFKRDEGVTFVSREIDTPVGKELSIGPGFDGLVDEVQVFDRAQAYGVSSYITEKATAPPKAPEVSPQLADDLIGYWRFDEGQGLAASDSSTSGYHGKLVNGASWQEGKFGSAVRLEQGQSVRIDGFQVPLGPSGKIEGFSVSLWAQYPLWFHQAFMHQGNLQTSGWGLAEDFDWAEFKAVLDGGGTPILKTARNDWGDIAFLFGDGFEWQHVAFVYDGAAGEMRIYVDGIEGGLSPVSCAGLDHILPAAQPLILGGCDWGGAFGALDEVAVWNRPLSEEEVSLLYNDGEGLVLSPLGTRSLKTGTCFIPASTGAAVNLALDGGVENGGRPFVIFGGVTGFVPGIPLPGGGATLPMNWDPFTGLALALSNTPPFTHFIGTLGPTGRASAALDTLGPVDPRYIGLTLYFAYALSNPWDEVSNPVSIAIGP